MKICNEFPSKLCQTNIEKKENVTLEHIIGIKIFNYLIFIK